MKKRVYGRGKREREKGPMGDPMGTPLSKNHSGCFKAVGDFFGSCSCLGPLASYPLRRVRKAHHLVYRGSLGAERDPHTPSLAK